MRTPRALIAIVTLALAVGSGCASQPAVITETVIYRDVNGTWRSTNGELVELTLAQQGSKVTGTLLTVAGGDSLGSEALIDGTLTGNVLRFKQAAGGTSIDGVLTVSGGEMSGELHNATVSKATRQVHLERVGSTSAPGSKK